MLCERPYVRTPTGVNKIQLLSEAGRTAATPFACGRCFACRLNKQRMITGRILMERQFHETSLFSTFTYAPEYIPEGNSLKRKDWNNFIRKAKKRLNFRYFATGEYGKDENTSRPHYHAIIFGAAPEDCNTLHDVWGMGRTAHGTVTYASARYVAGYAIKNMLRADDPRLKGREPEFHSSSRDPKGIGTRFIEEMAKGYETYGIKENEEGTVVIAGKRFPLGRYFGKLLSDRLCPDFGEAERAADRRLARYQDSIFKRYDTGLNWFDEITEPTQPDRDAIKKLYNLRTINHAKAI